MDYEFTISLQNVKDVDFQLGLVLPTFWPSDLQRYGPPAHKIQYDDGLHYL